MEDVSTDAKKSLTFPDEDKTENNGETVDEGDGVNGVHNMVTEDVHSNGVEEKEENHVATTNGDKAEPVVNGSSSAPAPVAAPVVTPAAPSATSAPPSRQRVPPGGFSSGLW
ncbi:uncharacterized protein LOC128992109 isoform X6 [Macrosteles quadrilineatus]|uniref:uncharacterized protein LOC128992109 isoform X6 n=1 Tax=Macrosteles quadrilineatus TaxID=74068 RepID=UPI0023E1FEB5|nr:uncharacterized protein LOC128992109 isoform X6 [Macrosteles quadrilineatus]